MASLVRQVDTNNKSLLDWGNEGRLPVDAVAISEQEHVARTHGYAFTAPFSVAVDATNKEFFYITNDDGEDQIVITRIQVQDAGAETLLVASCTGTPGGSPTEITPANRIIGSTNTADVTVYEGTDITGLTLTDTLAQKAVQAGVDTNLLDEPIILAPSQAVCVSAVTGGAAVVGTCWFYQAKHPDTSG